MIILVSNIHILNHVDVIFTRATVIYTTPLMLLSLNTNVFEYYSYSDVQVYSRTM